MACRVPDNRLSGEAFIQIAELSMHVYGKVEGRSGPPADSGCCVLKMPGTGGQGGLTLISSAPLYGDTFPVVVPGVLRTKGAWLRFERDGKVYESDSGQVRTATGFDVKMIGGPVRLVSRDGQDTLHLKLSFALGPL
jgi:hypothetical protein